MASRDRPPPVHKPGRFNWLRLKEQGALQVMVLLGVAWMFVFSYMPLRGLWIAFSDYRVSKPIFEAPWVGLKWFREFFTDRYIVGAIVNTLGISVLNMTIGFTVPIVFALLLNELPGIRYKRVVQTVSYLPHFISWVILGGFLISWTSQSGLINEVLMKLGVTEEPVYLLGEARYFWGVAVGSNIWKEMGWNAIIYIAAIAGINPELYEVASIEGANRFQRIWRITLPCIKGTIAILFILNIAYLLNSNFDQIYVLKNSLNADRSTVLDIYTYRIGIQQGRFSYSTAVGLIKSVVSLILLLVANKVSDKLAETSLF